LVGKCLNISDSLLPRNLYMYEIYAYEICMSLVSGYVDNVLNLQELFALDFSLLSDTA